MLLLVPTACNMCASQGFCYSFASLSIWIVPAHAMHSTTDALADCPESLLMSALKAANAHHPSPESSCVVAA